MNIDPQERLTAGDSVATLLIIGAAVAPHAVHLSPWLTGMFGLFAALRLSVNKRPRPVQHRAVLLGLTLVGLITTALASPSLNGRDGGVGLLVVMLGLKLVEMRTQRDQVILSLLGYFVVVTQFLYVRDLGLTLYLGLVVWALTTLLMHSQRANRDRISLGDLGGSGLILLQSLPVMAVLFLLFPRLEAPLWSFGTDDSVALTGLTDRLEPGSISRLVASGAIAFRVEAQGPMPPPDERYFRGPVFWSTNGRSWWEAPEGLSALPTSTQTQGIHQLVTMEPNGERWLPALDTPIAAPPGAALTADREVLANEPVRSRLTYEVISTIGHSDEILDRRRRRLALQVPADLSTRVRRLAASWRTDSATGRDIIGHALAYFRTQPFVYTLSPPRLGEHPTDRFLFESRSGFCEHYATSFTLLMRLAGLPARVVTGYQGGEINPRGGYLILRQSDAHAWSEVWLNREGWVRVDPTAAVAPQRIETPIDAELSRQTGNVRFAVPRLGPFRDLARQLRWSLDSLAIRWHYWVVGYSRARQARLLGSAGLGLLRGPAQAASAIILAMLVVGVIGFALRRHPHARTRSDPVRRTYGRFCTKMARAGLMRAPCEGPTDFARRAAIARPELATEIQEITALYVSLRYGRDAIGKLCQLRRRVARLRAIRALGARPALLARLFCPWSRGPEL